MSHFGSIGNGTAACLQASIPVARRRPDRSSFGGLEYEHGEQEPDRSNTGSPHLACDAKHSVAEECASRAPASTHGQFLRSCNRFVSNTLGLARAAGAERLAGLASEQRTSPPGTRAPAGP